MEHDIEQARVAEPLDVPPLPAPWRPADATPPLRGCGKPLLLGCGCATTALVAGLVLLNANAPKLLAWTTSEARERVLSALPGDVSGEERSRLEASFREFPGAVASGAVPMDSLLQAVGEINEAVAEADRGELTRERVLRLVEALEEAVASARRSPTSSPERTAAVRERLPWTGERS